MNLQQYRDRRRHLAEQEPRFRHLCPVCLQPGFGCYCADVRRFDPGLEFAILIHPIEVRRRIATGRMSHLCLERSHLIHGQDYTHDDRVNDLIQNPRNDCVLLYPGRGSHNLSVMQPAEQARIFAPDRNPVIFVIDGTWATARKMMRLSRNLHGLRQVCFTPPAPSRFRVRKQPAPECYSTIEAIHHVIELIGGSRGFPLSERRHDGLLQVFDRMVERQLELIEQSRRESGRSRYRPHHNGPRAD